VKPNTNCYCEEQKALLNSNGEKTENIPNGYCGLCEICGNPGHVRAHPSLPITGSWCDEHWDELVNQRVFTLADLIQPLFLFGIIGTGLYFLGHFLMDFF